MIRNSMILLIVLLIAPCTALAQGSGSTSRTSTTEGGHAVRKALSGTVSTIDTESGTIVVADRSGREHSFKVTKKTRYKAEKDTEFAGIKIGLADFQKGNSVKITYVASSDGVYVTEVRLRRS